MDITAIIDFYEYEPRAAAQYQDRNTSIYFT